MTTREKITAQIQSYFPGRIFPPNQTITAASRRIIKTDKGTYFLYTATIRDSQDQYNEYHQGVVQIVGSKRTPLSTFYPDNPEFWRSSGTWTSIDSGIRQFAVEQLSKHTRKSQLAGLNK